MSDLLNEIACPNCTHAIDLAGHGRQVQCAACNSQFILVGHLCPQCSQYHREEEPFCSRCGQALMRRCGNCRTRNWTGDEFCRQCGQQVDIFEMIQRHHSHSHRVYIERRREEIQQIKTKEAAGSQARMDIFMAQDQARLAQIQQQQQKQKRWDTCLIVTTFLALAACLATILLVFAYQFLTG